MYVCNGMSCFSVVFVGAFDDVRGVAFSVELVHFPFPFYSLVVSTSIFRRDGEGAAWISGEVRS